MSLSRQVVAELQQIDAGILGERIKVARLGAHLTQVDLGKAASITAAYVSRIEDGQRRPSLQVFEHFVDATGVPAEQLVGLQVALHSRLKTVLEDALAVKNKAQRRLIEREILSAATRIIMRHAE